MLSDRMYIEIFVFEDRVHDLTYDVEDDNYLQIVFDISDMRLDSNAELLDVVHENHSRIFIDH